MDPLVTKQIIAMMFLVIMSGYFSATETAFSSLNKTRLKTLIEKGNKRAELTYKLSENYDRLISTILIGNNIVNIALASIGTVFFVSIYKNSGATISTIVITLVVLIFGEITPKSMAKNNPEGFAMFSAPVIRFFVWLFWILNIMFTGWTKLISRLFKLENDTKVSQEELLLFVEEVEQEGSLDEDEGELIRNAIEFNELDAEDILTHRTDLVALPVEAEKSEFAKTFHETKFSRLLVYKENIDNVVGIVHQKDFYTDEGITKESIEDIMTPPIFVMKNEKIDDLLKSLQSNKSHIAVVVDEFGGTYGIVTMEDILEELVGEIYDEHDEVTVDFVSIGDNTFKVDGSVDFDEFCEFFEIEPESESVSLNGWIMEQLGSLPNIGDCFIYENLEIKVSEVEGHRIGEIIINKLFTDTEEKEENE